MKNPGRDSEAQLIATIASGWAARLAKPRDLAAVATRPPSQRLSRGRLVEANDNAANLAASNALNRRLCMLPLTDLGNAERFGHLVGYVDKIGGWRMTTAASSSTVPRHLSEWRLPAFEAAMESEYQAALADGGWMMFPR